MAPDRRGSLLLLAGMLVAMLALSEAAVRWLRPEEPPLRFRQLDQALEGDASHEFLRHVEPDPDLFWRLAPDVVLPDDGWPFFGRISNAEGVREDHSIPPRRGDREIRLLFLGDSNTFGYLLRLDETWVERIERRLAAFHPGLAVECINAGVPGYGLFQGWQLLRRRGFSYEPDLVVASFGWNDATERDGLSDLELHARMQAARPPLFSGSRLATLSWRLLRPLPDVSGRAPRARLWPAEYRALLDDMREESLAHDADLAVLVGAARLNAPAAYRDRRTAYQRVQLDFGRSVTLRDGVTPAALDTVPVVQELAEVHEVEELFFDANHATAIVHDRIAEAFVAWIQPWLAWRLAQR